MQISFKPLPLLNKLQSTQYRLRPTDTEDLESLEDVLKRYKSCVRKGEDGLLALMLVREAVFGPAVMAKCTPLGTKTKYALPQRKLYSIKRLYSNVTQSCGRSRNFSKKCGKSATQPYNSVAAGSTGKKTIVLHIHLSIPHLRITCLL